MKSIYLVLILGLIFLGSGCVVVDHHHHCYGPDCNTVGGYGDISFDWQFDNGHGTITTDCSDPYVMLTDVYFAIYNSGGGREFDGTLNCTDGGVTVYNFVEGTYTVHLEGLYNGTAYYGGDFYCDVTAGIINNCGFLTLTQL